MTCDEETTKQFKKGNIFFISKLLAKSLLTLHITLRFCNSHILSYWTAKQIIHQNKLTESFRLCCFLWYKISTPKLVKNNFSTKKCDFNLYKIIYIYVKCDKNVYIIFSIINIH